ncbi:MAG: hypothetical protein ACRC8S_19800, partial [Fimbriiglobus sp.]
STTSLINNASSWVIGFGDGTNRSIVNQGLIESNAGSMSINPSGSFTNSGTIRANAGVITINPSGGLIISAGSTMETNGSGQIQILTNNVSNAGTVSATSGTFDVAPTTTATYSNAVGGSTRLSSATQNVGNSSASAVNNASAYSISSGSTVNVGGTGVNRGLFTNTAGTTTLRGTLNSRRTTFLDGTLAGDGTVQGIAGTRALLLTSSAMLKPGNSPGQITIGGGLDINSGLEIEISTGGGGNNSTTVGNTTAGGGFDTVRNTPVDGNPSDIIVRTALSIRLVVESANLNTAFWAAPQSWQIMSTSNGAITFSNGVPGDPVTNIGIPAPTVFMLDPNNTNINTQITWPGSTFDFSIANSGAENRLMLNWNPVPVPEPTSILAVASIPLAGLAWRRRRRSQHKFVA